MSNSNRRLVDSFWDLRDNATDYPERWQDVEAEAIFQILATLIEQEEEKGSAIDWRAVVTRMIAWRGESSGNG